LPAQAASLFLTANWLEKPSWQIAAAQGLLAAYPIVCGVSAVFAVSAAWHFLSRRDARALTGAAAAAIGFLLPTGAVLLHHVMNGTLGQLLYASWGFNVQCSTGKNPLPFLS